MIYHYTCKCGNGWSASRPISKGPLQKPRCPGCGTRRTEHDWRGPVETPPMASSRRRHYMGEKGFKLYDESKKTLIQGTIDGNPRTAEQQEAIMSEAVRDKRRQALAAKRARGGSRRKDGELRLVGSVPAEMFRTVQNSQSNRHIWTQDTKRMLKKHGCYFGDD